ncbi:hypothetical protein GIB67_007383 [Kingdonia uniflora]|uniref:Pectinesterase n=1 Tax=Kingdonia uniflora TaxID=39325 RepID=A0A7J7KVM2_9MAGN|nr:hypothetical protein GIB67_007383 [Kingdonia uniflora]
MVLAIANSLLILLLLLLLLTFQVLQMTAISQEENLTIQAMKNQVCINMVNPNSASPTLCPNASEWALKAQLQFSMLHSSGRVSMVYERWTRLEWDYNPHEGNLRAWLSAALSNQDTCLEGFDGTRDRELVLTGIQGMHVDAVVALDGSGQFQSIIEAGKYRHEEKEDQYHACRGRNGSTVVSANRNFLARMDYIPNRHICVSGKGFIARDMTFRNTAGPKNQQAVALRVDSDNLPFSVVE